MGIILQMLLALLGLLGLVAAKDGDDDDDGKGKKGKDDDDDDDTPDDEKRIRAIVREESKKGFMEAAKEFFAEDDAGDQKPPKGSGLSLRDIFFGKD